jgi:hypothetical protein
VDSASRTEALSTDASAPEDGYVSLANRVLEESFDLVAPRGQDFVDRTCDRAFALAPKIAPSSRPRKEQE